MNLTDIDEIKALLARHGFRFSKSMGQNFLRSAWVPEEIAEASTADGGTGVLEVGPGIGCLTVRLAERAGKVVSVELDKALMPVLGETLRGLENVEVIFGDVLKKDLEKLASEELDGFERRVICANLPYNISTPALSAFARARSFECVTVMIQREVARRVCARENTADYGAFSVLMQWHFEPEPLFDVPPDCFIPAPKVTSSVIRLRRREEPPAQVRDEELMFAIVRAAFMQRRKTLANAIANCMGGRFEREQAAEAIRAIGLDERVRGEALSIAEFAALADRLGDF